MRKTLTGILCTLLCLPVAQADDRESHTRYAAADTLQPAWQRTGPALSYADYRRSVDRNRNLVKAQLEVCADRLVEQAGDYGRAVSLVGAAVAVAATDRRYHLNDSKTVGMVLRDTSSSDRTVLLEYRRFW